MLDGSGGPAWGGVPWPGFAPGTEVAGFIIEGLLATGSSGTVYRAQRSGRRYALKLIPLDARGDREAGALRQLRHPNVVGFHGYGFWPEEQPRALVLALELVQGLPLDEWALEVNPSALELVSHVLLPLALTVADVHASGVVHRDLKEANIVMREADGLPVLVDFGAAGFEGSLRLTRRLPPGTAEYRSPEAYRFAREWGGEPYPAGPGDDLWAMGVVTYALLTRRLPFGDRNDPGMVRAILERTPPAPHELNPHVPPALGELCLRMLEKEPEARYADARALAEALATGWSQADRAWRVPLFPGAGRAKHPAPPPPAPVVPERKSPWRQWLTGAAPAMALGLLIAPSAQLLESPPPPPPPQASPRQELAPPRVTGEVGLGAEPRKSPTPAPVANATSNEESKMTNSQKRALTVAAITALSCVGPGCAGTPIKIEERQTKPPSDPCPAGAAETHKRLGILKHAWQAAYFGDSRTLPASNTVAVSEGKVTIRLLRDLGQLKADTPLYGKLLFMNARVVGGFSSARLPDGEVVPICMFLDLESAAPGLPMLPGSTTKKAILDGTTVFVMSMY